MAKAMVTAAAKPAMIGRNAGMSSSASLIAGIGETKRRVSGSLADAKGGRGATVVAAVAAKSVADDWDWVCTGAGARRPAASGCEGGVDVGAGLSGVGFMFWVKKDSLARSGFIDNFGEFARIDVLQAFVSSFQFLKRFEDGLGHAAVSLVGTADKDELFASGDTFVAVLIIQTDAEQPGCFGR